MRVHHRDERSSAVDGSPDEQQPANANIRFIDFHGAEALEVLLVLQQRIFRCLSQWLITQFSGLFYGL